MKTRRTAISSTAFAVGIIVALIVAGGGGYFYGTSVAPSSVSTTTVISTVSGGTITVTASAGNSAPQLSVLAQDAVAAQQECGTQSTCLTVYSTVDCSDWQADMAPNFYQEFPWANGKVNWVCPSASQVTSMAISEHQANHVVGDMLVVTEGIMYPVLLAGGILNYSSPVAPLANETCGSGGAYCVAFLSMPVIQYNPQQMTALNLPIPKTWQDLGNSVYKGHLGFQTATSLSATTGIFYYLYTQMGNSSWTSLMNNIAANSPIITRSASATTDNILTGKVALGIGLYNDYLSAHATNATLMGYVAPSPNVYNPGVVTLTKGSHPAMGKLLEDWLLSNMGAQGFAETARSPNNNAISSIFGLLPSGVTLVNSYTNPAIFSNPTSWTTLFHNIFGA